MIALDQTEIRARLPWPLLVNALRRMFIDGCEAPLRHHHEIAVPGGEAGTLLLMPAWRSGEFLGVKVVNVFPGNARRDLPTVSGVYILSDSGTGEILAQLDGGELTARRTAAASALAASYLARRDSHDLLVIGTGRVSRNLPGAYCAVRPIERVHVYGRDREKTQQYVRTLESSESLSVRFEVVTDLAAALREVDIVASATVATQPIIHGRDLPSGIHVDLIGGYRPDMREADDDAIRRADSIFVDTREGAPKEAGDLAQPIASGILDERSIAADLHELCAELHRGRSRDQDVTLFKSVGAAIEDLAAAAAAYLQYSSSQGA